jgi:hypothetical protein
VDGSQVVTLSLIDPDTWTTDALDLDWDVMLPTEVDASQVSLTSAGTTRGADIRAARVSTLRARTVIIRVGPHLAAPGKARTEPT